MKRIHALMEAADMVMTSGVFLVRITAGCATWMGQADSAHREWRSPLAPTRVMLSHSRAGRGGVGEHSCDQGDGHPCAAAATDPVWDALTCSSRAWGSWARVVEMKDGLHSWPPYL